jgi:biopolymer transport protein ExbD
MKRKAKRVFENPQLNMTPMIDVVFQLMIFFLVTLKKEDIISHLDVNRPMAEKPTEVKEQELLTILVYKDGYVLQGTRIALEELERQLKRVSSFDKSASVIIKCTNDSPHSHLVKLLDLCSKYRLTNLSVFSM